MLHPRRTLDIAIAFAICGAGGAWLLHVTQPPGKVAPWRDMSMVMLWCIALYAVISFLPAGNTYRKYLRVKRGIGVLASWSVPLAEWQQFVQNELAIESQPGALRNRIEFSKIKAHGDVLVVVSNEALIVGNDYHQLDVFAWRVYNPTLTSSNPAAFEIRIETMDPDDEIVLHVLRFPVPNAALTDAQSVIERFR